MKSIKAIIAGSVFILVIILFLQLLYIFAAVAYNGLAKDYPLLNDITEYFRYLIGIPIFITLMFSGGYITATIADMKRPIQTASHCLVVGLFTSFGMLYPTLESATITTTGLVIIAMSLGATIFGGVYWQKNQSISNLH